MIEILLAIFFITVLLLFLGSGIWVAISMIGVSSIGMSVPEIYNSLREGRPGIGQLEFPDITRLKVKTGGQIKNFDPSKHFELKQVSRMDRFSQFALLAAKEAITNSGLENSNEEWPENAGVILGSSIGGIETINYSYKQVFENGHNRLHPLTTVSYTHLTLPTKRIV